MTAVRADRLACAFLPGYQAALETLTGRRARQAFCVTEAAGNHPRAIQTTLEYVDGKPVLNGEKTFVTMGRAARELLVLASAGTDSAGRPALRCVRVPSDIEGVEFVDAPAVPFVPEVAHARVLLSDVRLDPSAVLPGDGYDDFSKPFRTIEDIFVTGAIAAYLFGVAARDWPEGERPAWALLQQLQGLSDAGSKDPSTHVALDACLGAVGEFGDDASARLSDAGERDRWARDRKLLSVAAEARQRRFERARDALRP